MAAATVAKGGVVDGVASPLSAVCRFWTEFDLEAMRSKLDEEGLKVAEHQEDSMQNRRKLAESTKEFKKAVTAEGGGTSKLFQGLLKQYQEEIDRLTKRAKHGESSFLELYQKLYEAPDPAPALSMAFETASRVSELEAQCRKTGNELAEYKAEALSIKNQDLTIRKLEEKIRSLEAHLEEKDFEVEEVKEKAVADADAARMIQMQEREQELSAMLAEAQSSLSSMQKVHHATQNQLFAIQSQSEDEVAGVQAELDLASTELERVQGRVQSLELEKSTLVNKLGSGGEAVAAPERRNVSDTDRPSGVEENLRNELGMQREMTSRLRMEVTSLKRDADEAHSMWESRLQAVRSTLQAAEHHVKTLEEELHMRPTVQQAALMQKNRHLEHELTMLRLKAVDNKQALDAALSRVGDLEASLAEAQELVTRLEDDLATTRAALGRACSTTSSHGKLSSIMSPHGQGDGADEEEGADSSMVRVICSQRDRFRQKVVELEEELGRVQAELGAAKKEATAAKADNVALVERLRYVHGYKQNQRGGADLEVGADVEQRYTRMYEDGINPFKEFQGKQRETQKSTMSYVDRAMYMFGQLVYGNKSARLFTFLYLSVLHVLVVTSLMRLSHHTSSQLYAHQHTIPEHGRHDMAATMLHENVPGIGADARLP
eukprot:gene17047-23340_t